MEFSGLLAMQGKRVSFEAAISTVSCTTADEKRSSGATPATIFDMSELVRRNMGDLEKAAGLLSELD